MRRRYSLIQALFFASGFAGLAYEIVWSKYLALFLGATGYAQLLVLATFMGGLALGSWRLGAFADRAKRPLACYAWLEVGIGLWGLLFPFIFPPIREGFLTAAAAMNLNFGQIFALKIVVCVILILVPTILMGGTLPVMTRAIVPYLAAVGRNVSSLYYINSFGAAAGCLVGGMVLIPWIGLHWTNWTAAALNLLAAAGAALILADLERRDPAAKLGRTAEVESSAADEPVEPDRLRRIALWVAGCSGALAMLYEVAWIRLLTLSMGSSTYSFSLMLAAFITGITIGSWALSKKRSPRGYYFLLGICQVSIGLLVLLSLPIYQELPSLFYRWATMLARVPHAFPLYNFFKFALCFVVMVPPAIFFGISLPAASHVVSDKWGLLGRKIGGVFAVNTMGTIVGTLVSGLVLLPTIGLQGTLLIGLVGNFLLGFTVLFTCVSSPAVRRMRLASVAVFVCGLSAYLGLASEWNIQKLNMGLYLRRYPTSKEEKTNRNQQSRRKAVQPALIHVPQPDSQSSVGLPLEQAFGIKYYRDGVNATVAVFEDRRDNHHLVLKINGKPDASSQGDLASQMMVGHLPMLLKGDAKRVLIVGLGSGISMGSVLRYPVEAVDVVEISPEVIEAVEQTFGDHNYHAIKNGQASDPRARVFVEDAKTFMQVTPKKYDVIVNEPTNPWIAGVAGLFTEEFFKTCAQRLTDDGVLVQWVQVYEFEDRTMELILRTLQRTFPYVSLWSTEWGDTAMISSRRPIEPNFARMEQLIALPEVNKDLGRLGIHSLLGVLMLQMGEIPPPRGTPDPGPINSDYHPLLEYWAPVGVFLGHSAPMVDDIDFRLNPTYQDRLWISRYHPSRKLTSDEYFDFYRRSYTNRLLKFELILSWTKQWVADWPDDERAQAAAIFEGHGGLDEKRRLFEERLIPASTRLDVWETYSQILIELADLNRFYLLNHEDPGYERALRKCIELGAERPWRYYYLLGEYYLYEGRCEQAGQALRQGIGVLGDGVPGRNALEQEFRVLLAETLAKQGLNAEARAELARLTSTTKSEVKRLRFLRSAMDMDN